VPCAGGWEFHIREWNVTTREGDRERRDQFYRRWHRTDGRPPDRCGQYQIDKLTAENRQIVA